MLPSAWNALMAAFSAPYDSRVRYLEVSMSANEKL